MYRRGSQGNGVLELVIEADGAPIEVEITQAIFGRATSVAVDQTPEFTFAGGRYTAPSRCGAGQLEPAA